MFRPKNEDQYRLIYGGYWKLHLPFDISKFFSSIDNGFDGNVETCDWENVIKLQKILEFVIIPPTVVHRKPKNTVHMTYLGSKV
jgi:hypothetical protein